MKFVYPRTHGYILEAGEFVMNTENLLKLADYLETQAKQETFDMKNFAATINNTDPYWTSVELIADDSPRYHECGTVCCAVGSGVKAGIPFGDAEGWQDYSNKNFIDSDSYDECVEPKDAMVDMDILLNDPWEWCFGGGWVRIDNTPTGAAKRIRYLVEHGTAPDTTYDQLERDVPYMFAESVNV